MTACAGGNRDNVADDNTATGTNERRKITVTRSREKRIPMEMSRGTAFWKIRGCRGRWGKRCQRRSCRTSLTEEMTMTGHTEKRMDENGNGTKCRHDEWCNGQYRTDRHYKIAETGFFAFWMPCGYMPRGILAGPAETDSETLKNL